MPQSPNSSSGGIRRRKWQQSSLHPPPRLTAQMHLCSHLLTEPNGPPTSALRLSALICSTSMMGHFIPPTPQNFSESSSPARRLPDSGQPVQRGSRPAFARNQNPHPLPAAQRPHNVVLGPHLALRHLSGRLIVRDLLRGGFKPVRRMAKENHAEHWHAVFRGSQFRVAAKRVRGLPESGFQFFNISESAGCGHLNGSRRLFGENFCEVTSRF